MTNDEPIRKARFSKNFDIEFWIDYGKEGVKNTLSGLDERAKYMITTCSGLIIIEFGLLLSFPSHHIQVTPQFFFVVSAAIFIVSYFPIKKNLNLFSTKSIKESYQHWLRWKLIWHYAGFGFFVAGLLALAITSLTYS